MLWSNGKLCFYDLQPRELTNACELSRLRYRRHRSAELEPIWKDVSFNVMPYVGKKNIEVLRQTRMPTEREAAALANPTRRPQKS